MNATKTVREHVLLALVYWIIGLAGGYWLGGAFIILVLVSPLLHCLSLSLMAMTTPIQWRYWLAIMCVLMIAGIGLAVLLYMSDISD